MVPIRPFSVNALVLVSRPVLPDQISDPKSQLVNLGFEWLIEGDDNHSAQVDVSYRKLGENQWKRVFDVVSPNMFAGSILELGPKTEYKPRFVMTDPDGVQGKNVSAVTKTVTVRTRHEPMPFSGVRVFHVYPPRFKGAKVEPAFDALMCARGQGFPGRNGRIVSHSLRRSQRRLGGRRRLSPVETLFRSLKRTIKSGDIRKDLDPIDLLRALVGVANVATSPDWPQSARRLVEILFLGARPLK